MGPSRVVPQQQVGILLFHSGAVSSIFQYDCWLLELDHCYGLWKEPHPLLSLPYYCPRTSPTFDTTLVISPTEIAQHPWDVTLKEYSELFSTDFDLTGP